jgi:SNF2 family DNA or RNA helicase
LETTTIDNSGLLEQRALNVLHEYEGANNYILKLKGIFNPNKRGIPTRSQCEYILNYSQTTPKVAKKWVELDDYFAEKISNEKLYTTPPKQVWVEKLLVEKDKSYHIWGRFFDSEPMTDFWLPKASIIKNPEQYYKEIDYSKYSHRPLLSHQIEAVEKLVKTKRFILADDMGLGKTTSTIVAALETEAKKILIICPASLKINWQREIENYTDRSTYICGSKRYEDADFVIVNYDILKNFHDPKDRDNSRILKSNFDLVVLDECFTYDTKIMTELGEMNIGDIVENGIDVKILTFNHKEQKLEYKKINRWIRKRKDSIYKIKFSNGLFIECTDNHKFYVNKKGYVRAKDLTPTDDLYMLPETFDKKTNLEKSEVLFKKLCINNEQQEQITKTKRIKIPKKLSKMWECNEFYDREKNEPQDILFSRLFKYGNIKQSICKRKTKKNNRKKWWVVGTYEKNSQDEPSSFKKHITKNDNKQSDEKSGKSIKNERKVKRKNLSFKRWKWKNNTATRNLTSVVGGRMGDGITHTNKGCQRTIQKFTKFIQGRHWESKTKNFNRSRWKFTQNKKMEIFRPKKNEGIKFVRVDSIEIFERGSYDKSTKVSSKDTRVYDLEISDNHNYFANSILVSNCHYVQNSQAQRTKLINDFVKGVDRLWLLTGTPITSRPINYFNLLNLVDSPVAQNWMAYVIRYCEGYQFKAGNRKVWNVMGASNLEELRDRTSRQVLRRLKTDVLDLPDKIITPVYLRLKSKEYEELMGEYFEWYEKNPDESSSLTVQFTKLTKVRQIIANEKIRSTIELVENILEQDKKVIVFTNFTDSLNKIYEHFGKKAVYLDGSCSPAKRQNAVDEFQNNDKIKVFVGNLKAAGVGITLTSAEAVIMNDLSFVPSDHAQAEDRSYRYGQKSNVSVYYPIFENTIEGVIYDILNKKKNIFETVMGDNVGRAEIVQEIMNQIFDRR